MIGIDQNGKPFDIVIRLHWMERTDGKSPTDLMITTRAYDDGDGLSCATAVSRELLEYAIMRPEHLIGQFALESIMEAVLGRTSDD